MVNYLFEISQSIAKSNKKTVTKIQISSLLAELNGISPSHLVGSRHIQVSVAICRHRQP
jgi:hypothetical protein